MKSLPLKSCYKLLQHQFLRRQMIHQSETMRTNFLLYSVSNRIWMLWSLTSRREPHCSHNSVLTRCLCLLMRLLGQMSKNVWTMAVIFVSLQKGEKQFWEGQTSKFSYHGGTYVWIIFSYCTFQEVWEDLQRTPFWFLILFSYCVEEHYVEEWFTLQPVQYQQSKKEKFTLTLSWIWCAVKIRKSSPEYEIYDPTMDLISLIWSLIKNLLKPSSKGSLELIASHFPNSILPVICVL